jgi:hypothetical protein
MNTIIFQNLGLIVMSASQGIHPCSMEYAWGIHGLATSAYLNDPPETRSWTA